MTTTITARQVTELRAITLITDCACYCADQVEWFPEDCPKHRLWKLLDELDPQPTLPVKQAIV